MFIFSLINILAYCQKKMKKKRLEGALENYTSDKEACSQKFVLLFQGRYNYLIKLQSAKSFSASQKIKISKCPIKGKTTRKGKKKEKEKREKRVG